MSLKRSLLLAAVASAAVANAADHLDSSAVMSDPRLDLNDLYAFQSPTDSSRAVLVMTVNPGAGVIGDKTFNSSGVYKFNVDFDGDARPDTVFAAYFTPVRRDGVQFMVIQRNGRNIGYTKVGTTRSLFNFDGFLTAGLFEDPFFFDLNGFRDNFQFTGDDFFAGLDVTAIVLELPIEEIGSAVGIWATTELDGLQFDRVGRPGINTVIVPSNRKNTYNFTKPQNDLLRFGQNFEDKITELSGDRQYAQSLVPVLLPDILTVDFTSSDGYLNGRRLDDDVIDASLTLLTQGALTSDMVDLNDAVFQPIFPYLAPPNGVPADQEDSGDGT